MWSVLGAIIAAGYEDAFIRVCADVTRTGRMGAGKRMDWSSTFQLNFACRRILIASRHCGWRIK